MAAHDFSFEGGEILADMGATWFVSYAFYERMDNTHRNWERVATARSRISKYNKGRKFHQAWLTEVLAMSPANLNKNTIGLNAENTKEMAKKLLDNWK